MTVIITSNESEVVIINHVGASIAYVNAAIAAALPYKVYTALLTQSGTNAPVATVLQNTLGGIVVWTRHDLGDYYGTLAGAFPQGKTISLNFPSLAGSITVDSENLITALMAADPTGNFLELIVSEAGTQSDNWLSNFIVDVRVYP